MQHVDTLGIDSPSRHAEEQEGGNPPSTADESEYDCRNEPDKQERHTADWLRGRFVDYQQHEIGRKVHYFVSGSVEWAKMRSSAQMAYFQKPIPESVHQFHPPVPRICWASGLFESLLKD